EENDVQLQAQLAAIVHDPSAALLCAEVRGEVVGLAEVYLRRDEPHPLRRETTYGYLQSLMVTERWRRCGIGGRLIAAAEAWARVLGATQLRLDAWEFTGGPSPFYEGHGYLTVKREFVKDLEQ